MATAFYDAWHRQPDPANRAERPTGPQWRLVSALWLLADWAPEATPGWEWTLEVAQTGESGDAVPTEELVRLIAEAAHVDDARRMSLVRCLVNDTARTGDLVRLTGTDDDAALHLLFRDYFGAARVTIAAAPTVERPPVIAGDGPDGALRTRISSLATLLSARLMVNNNNPVDFRFRIGELPEGDAHGDLAAAVRWWRTVREDAEDHADEEPTFRPIAFSELRTSLHNIARLSLVDLWDGSWDGIEEMPEIPAGHVATHLVDDLMDVIEDRMGGALVAVNGYLPREWPPQERDDDGEDYEYVYVLFVRGDEVGVLDIDQSGG